MTSMLPTVRTCLFVSNHVRPWLGVMAPTSAVGRARTREEPLKRRNRPAHPGKNIVSAMHGGRCTGWFSCRRAVVVAPSDHQKLLHAAGLHLFSTTCLSRLIPCCWRNTRKAGSKSGQHAVKLSLQQQIDSSRATAKEYDQAYRRDVEVIKSIEESLISVFNKVRAVAASFHRY